MGNQLSTWNLTIQSAVDGPNFNYNSEYNQVSMVLIINNQNILIYSRIQIKRIQLWFRIHKLMIICSNHEKLKLNNVLQNYWKINQNKEFTEPFFNFLFFDIFSLGALYLCRLPKLLYWYWRNSPSSSTSYSLQYCTRLQIQVIFLHFEYSFWSLLTLS